MGERERRFHPILFSAPMVRALLDGRKTQTRRIIKPRAALSLFDGTWSDTYVLDPGNKDWRARDVRYAVGDLLWVRESVRAGEDESNFDRQVEYLADGATRRVADCEDNSSEEFGRWWVLNSYRATDPDLDGGKIVSPRHMPRWASRLTLAVTDVRVQRLKEISEEDAIAEGVERLHHGWFPYGISTFLTTVVDGREVPAQCCRTARQSFRLLWNSINGPGAWEANPWVVALTFTVHHCNVDQMAEALASLPATATSTGG